MTRQDYHIVFSTTLKSCFKSIKKKFLSSSGPGQRDLEGDLERDLEGYLEGELEGDSKGDFRGDF